MSKRLSILFCSGLLIYSLMNADLVGIISFGAPPSSTGAPGEITCAESGCHDDGPKPMKNSSHSLLISSRSNVLQPGDTAQITIRVAESNIRRFGFQLTALDAHGKSAGTFLITDTDKTQLLQNHIAFADREYVTYTKNGTLSLNTGNHEWKFEWVVPQKHIGPISFYLATVSANDDNRDKGDKVYLMDTTIQVQQTTGIVEEQLVKCKQFGGTFIVNNPGFRTALNIFSIDGSKIESHIAENGESVIDIHHLSKGLYMLQSETIYHPFIR